MINQAKTGLFISDMRKAKNLTQKQLADMIGVSDKAISRWETGRGMPDTSIMAELCNALDINVNELLSGQRLSEDDYNGKAEAIMVDLIKEKELEKRHSKGDLVGLIIGVVLLLLFIWSLSIISGGLNSIGHYIDIPSFVAVIAIQLIVISAAGQFGTFIQAFKLIFVRKKYDNEQIPTLASDSIKTLSLAIKATIIGGIISSIAGCIIVLTVIFDEPSLIGPNLAVAFLTVFYALIFSLILLIIQGRLQKLEK